MNDTVTPEQLAKALVAHLRTSSGDFSKAIEKCLIRAQCDGIREGLRMYAWWKDGVEQVGTCGRTLREALAKVDQKEKEMLES